MERRRGKDTKEKLLEEACKVFAEKGYRDATHAEICRRAGANVAAINYYFTSKEALYQAVFEHLTEQVNTLYPLDGGLSITAAPEKRLHAFVHGLLRRMFDPEGLGGLHRIRMKERFEPTGIIEELLARQLARDRECILRVLRELLGPEARQKDVEWCEMSVIGQCFISAPGPGDGTKGPRVIFGLTAAETDRLANHITTFSLAGVEAIRRRIQGETASASREPQRNAQSSEDTP